EPDLDARRRTDRDRHRLGDQEGPAGEPTDELPGVPPVNTDTKGYYRSLEQLADTPEFQAFAREEFPGFANVYESLGEAELKDDPPEAAGLNRRKFLALSAAALGMAGLAGCRRPDLEILPFSAIPDDQIGYLAPGKPTFYSTSIPRPGGA